MTPTNEIDDPTWHDIFDRDDMIKGLVQDVAALKARCHELELTLLNENGRGSPPSARWAWKQGNVWMSLASDGAVINIKRDEYGGWLGHDVANKYALCGDTARQLMKAFDEKLKDQEVHR